MKAIEDLGTVEDVPATNPPSIVRAWVSVAAKAKSEEKPKDAGKQGK